MAKGPGLASRSDCAYYRSLPGGICTSGCWEEPTCFTDEPVRGWLASEANALRDLAWEERGNHAAVKRARDLMRHFEKREARRA